MGNFIDSVILTFTDFGAAMKNSFSNLDKLLGKYSYPSFSIIPIFIVSKVLTEAIKASTTNDNIRNILTTKRGFSLIHFLYIFIVFMIDFFIECDKEKSIVSTSLAEGLKQASFSIIPLYGIIIAFVMVIPNYSKVREKVHPVISNILEGVVVFLLYNWTINFRRMNDYNKCHPITDAEISDTVVDKEKEAVLRGTELPFGGMKKPETRQVTKTKTEITTDIGSKSAKITIETGQDAKEEEPDTTEEEEEPDTTEKETKKEKEPKVVEEPKPKKKTAGLVILSILIGIFILAFVAWFLILMYARKEPMYDIKDKQKFEKAELKEHRYKKLKGIHEEKEKRKREKYK